MSSQATRETLKNVAQGYGCPMDTLFVASSYANRPSTIPLHALFPIEGIKRQTHVKNQEQVGHKVIENQLRFPERRQRLNIFIKTAPCFRS